MRADRHAVVLPFQKGEAVKRPILPFLPTAPVRLPIARVGEDGARLLVQADTHVTVGQILAEGGDGAPVLSTVDGVLTGTVVLTHPRFGELTCIELLPDLAVPAADDAPVDAPAPASAAAPGAEMTAQQILAAARRAAICDERDGRLLADKLAGWQLPADDPSAQRCVLVADGTENDIFGSAAWAVLEETPQQVLDGLRLAARALHFPHCHIAVLLPKRRLRALRRAVGRDTVFVTENTYPLPAYADKKQEAFVIGAQACAALWRAVATGEGATHVVVTVGGDGVPESANVRVPYGTDIGELLSAYGADPAAECVLGDAMTGIACPDVHTPLLPGTDTVLSLAHPFSRTAGPCMGCGRCAAVCHAGLLPYEIARRLENMHYERLQHLDAQACDGCGACSYVCPAGRQVTDEVLAAADSRGTMLISFGGENDE